MIVNKTLIQKKDKKMQSLHDVAPFRNQISGGTSKFYFILLHEKLSNDLADAYVLYPVTPDDFTRQ